MRKRGIGTPGKVSLTTSEKRSAYACAWSKLIPKNVFWLILPRLMMYDKACGWLYKFGVLGIKFIIEN